MTRRIAQAAILHLVRDWRLKGRQPNTAPRTGYLHAATHPRPAEPTDTGLAREPRTTKGRGRVIESSVRGVAQPGSAPDWGSGGRRFESCRPDHLLVPMRCVPYRSVSLRTTNLVSKTESRRANASRSVPFRTKEFINCGVKPRARGALRDLPLLAHCRSDRQRVVRTRRRSTGAWLASRCTVGRRERASITRDAPRVARCAAPCQQK